MEPDQHRIETAHTGGLAEEKDQGGGNMSFAALIETLGLTSD